MINKIIKPVVVLAVLIVAIFTLIPDQNDIAGHKTNGGVLFLKGLYHGFVTPVTAIAGLFQEEVVTAEYYKDDSPYTYGYMIGIYLFPIIIYLLSSKYEEADWNTSRKVKHLLGYGYLLAMLIFAALLFFYSATDLSIPVSAYKPPPADPLIGWAFIFITSLLYPLILSFHLILSLAFGYYKLAAPLTQLYGFDAIIVLIGIWFYPLVVFSFFGDPTPPTEGPD